ncbi:MAG: hypothetical protein IPK60_22260 [Sandaracinaceae bacterium]|nr:hypothetical protein [Sandaracinaceae bacterium]
MKKSPLARVTETFKDKKSLIEAVKGLATDDLWLDRTNKDKGLDRVSSQKLLRLHETLSAVKKEFKTRDGLIKALAKSVKREKDTGFVTRVSKYSTPRLWDAYKSASK